MKKFVDFETKGPLGKVIDQVIGIESDNSSEEAGLILTDSEDKVLRYLQKTEKRACLWDRIGRARRRNFIICIGLLR